MSCLSALEHLQGITERYNGLMSVVPGGILFVSSDGLILEANDRISELTGYEPWELFGSHLDVLQVPGYPSLRSMLDEYLRDLAERRRYREVLLRKKDGTSILALGSRFMFEDSEGAATFIDMFYPAGWRG